MTGVFAFNLDEPSGIMPTYVHQDHQKTMLVNILHIFAWIEKERHPTTSCQSIKCCQVARTEKFCPSNKWSTTISFK